MNNRSEPPARMLLNPQPGRETAMQFVVDLYKIMCSICIHTMNNITVLEQINVYQQDNLH